jgi:hypothetical protein
LIKDGEALRSPRRSPGAAGFKAKENKHKFAFSPGQLGRLVTPTKACQSSTGLVALLAWKGDCEQIAIAA